MLDFQCPCCSVQLASCGVQVFQFVGVTITNKLAANSPDAPGLTPHEQHTRTQANAKLVSYSITFAVIAGSVTSACLLSCGERLLLLMGTSAATLKPALAYLSWRALATPAVLLMNVCQGICLGQQNSATPLAVFTSVGVLNVLLDVALVVCLSLGCAGAGMATPIAQWAGVRLPVV